MADIRSKSLPFKRDKDQSEKWSYGARPISGVRVDYNASTFEEELVGGTEASRQKSRPRGPWAQEYKNHSNKTKVKVHTYMFGRSAGRISSKTDAVIDAKEAATAQLSQSLLDLLPQHTNNPTSAIQTAIRGSAPEGDIFFSFDNKGPSPGYKGTTVDLGGLVEKAQKQWDNKQTEKIVKGEYEILDSEGEATVLGRKKKGSPKQKASKSPATAPKIAVEEDDGFELV